VNRTQKVTAPDDVLIREIDGESVLVNLDKGQYYGLDDVGTHLFQLLTTRPNVGAALETALAEYDTDAETLERDVEALMERLVAEGLIEVSDGEPAP